MHSYRIILTLFFAQPLQKEINAMDFFETIYSEPTPDESDTGNTLATDVSIYSISDDLKSCVLQVEIQSEFNSQLLVAESLVWGFEHPLVERTEFSGIE